MKTPRSKPSQSARPRLRIAEGASRRDAGPFLDHRGGGRRASRAGRMIIVVDDEDRENEGDLTMAAEKVTPEAVNFMITHARGLLCLSMTPRAARRARHSAEVVGQLVAARRRRCACRSTPVAGTSTGVSAPDRAATILRGARSGDRSRTIWRGPDTCSRCGRARAACSCAPGTPRPPSIWRASPA